MEKLALTNGSRIIEQSQAWKWNLNIIIYYKNSRELNYDPIVKI